MFRRIRYANLGVVCDSRLCVNLGSEMQWGLKHLNFGPEPHNAVLLCAEATAEGNMSAVSQFTCQSCTPFDHA